MKKVLLIDKDQAYVSDLEQALKTSGYQVATAVRADEGLQIGRAHV